MSALFHLVCVEETIENEIARGCNQRHIAQTYALAIRSDWPTDWPRVNRAIVAKWPKSLDRIKRMAWSGACFQRTKYYEKKTSPENAAAERKEG